MCPDTSLAAAAGVSLGLKGAIVVDREMRTNLPDVFAGGDCVETYHRILGTSYLPLEPPPTSKAGWQVKMRSEAIASLLGALGPR